MTRQRFTSAKTDLKQIPAIFKILMKNLERPAIFFAMTKEILDYGGGAGDKLTDKLAELKVRNLVLDPFNRSEDHNKLVRQVLKIRPADHAICSNVLNVIKEPKIRMAALEEIARLTSPGGLVFFTVYEGDKSSRGRKTKGDCWQANRPLKSYVREIRKVFSAGYYFAGGKALVCSPLQRKTVA
jgi:hypothetical protein